MATSALDWCSVDRLKTHLSFAQDSDGSFINTEQDVTLLDSIQGAVSWCQQYTGLPLLSRTTTIRTPFERSCNPALSFSSVEHPLILTDVLYFERVTTARYYAGDDRRVSEPTNITNVDLRYRRVFNTGRFETWWVMPYTQGEDAKRTLWPQAPGGYELDVVESVPVATLPVVTNAVVLVARDLYDGGNIMERRTTAQHILEPFRVIRG